MVTRTSVPTYRLPTSVARAPTTLLPQCPITVQHIQTTSERDFQTSLSQYTVRFYWTTPGIDGLLFVGELSAYEADLKEQWARYMDRLSYETEFSGNLEEEVACVQFGRRVLDWVETASFPIRAAMPPNDEYITRGTFHILANEDLPALYWHPKLLDKLAEIAALATA